MAGPLAGLKVIEMTGLGPCPLAGQLLADMGAEVVVIDRASAPADPTDVNRRGKRSVALNLKSAGGVEAAKRLIARADVLIEGFRPGVMEKLGLGPDQLQDLNPGLIYGRMTGWGQAGPLSHSAGHDINYLSITGALHAIGTPETPIPPLNLGADYGGGTMFLLFGLLSALYERQRSGRGQVIDAAMCEGAPALMGLIHQWYAQGSWTAVRGENLLDGGAPFYRCYATGDGRHMSVGALEPQFFARLVALLEVGDEVDIARQYDRATWPAMADTFARAFAARSMADWAALFEGTDACVAPVLTFEEAEAHPQNVARGSFCRVGGVLQSSPAPRLARTPAPPPRAPGAPGAETEAVLAEAGLDPAQIAALRDEGAIG